MNTLQAARKSAGISQAELASQVMVSRHSILRLEQLCYPTPLPNVIETLSDITGLSVAALTEGYLADVKANRITNGNLLFGNGRSTLAYNVAIKLETQYSEKSLEYFHRAHEHMFTRWRALMAHQYEFPDSAIHFSQMFSIHPAVLSRYESFKTSFPHMMEVAFVESGIQDTQHGNALLSNFKNHVYFNMTGD